MKLIRSAVFVGTCTALSRLGGFVREWLQAYYIGASYVSDALNYAISFPSFFRRIFAEGAFNASFVPLFSEILTTQSVQEARAFAQSILSILVMMLTFVVGVVVIFSDSIMPLFLPGLKGDPACLELVKSFTRITFPFLFFISLTAFFSGMLNSIDRFIAAASSPAVGNLSIIFCLVFATDFGMNPGKALSFGILACGIVQFLWVFLPSQTHGIHLSLKIPIINAKVKVFFKRLLPAALGASVFQMNLIMDMSLASYLPKGAFSHLKYADRFAQLPLSIIGTAISTALLPLLSKQWRKGKTKEAMSSQNKALEFALFFALPSTVCLMAMAPDLIGGFYAHGQFSQKDIFPTALTLMVLSSGLPAYILVKVLSTSFFSQGDTRTPVKIALFAIALNFILNISLIWSFQQLALAFSTSISSWINAFLLGILLKRKGFLKLDKDFKRFLPRIILISLMMVGYSLYLAPLARNLLFPKCFWNWAQVCLSIALFGIVYLILCYFLKILTWKKVRDHISSAE